jgi:hypothetical protein
MTVIPNRYWSSYRQRIMFQDGCPVPVNYAILLFQHIVESKHATSQNIFSQLKVLDSVHYTLFLEYSKLYIIIVS